jgi:hypothetical protein
MPLRKVRRPAVASVESGPLTASSNLATRFELAHGVRPAEFLLAGTDHRSITACSAGRESTVLPMVLRHRLPRSMSLELVSDAPQRP